MYFGGHCYAGTDISGWLHRWIRPSAELSLEDLSRVPTAVMPLRKKAHRLDAESLRDSILAVWGISIRNYR